MNHPDEHSSVPAPPPQAPPTLAGPLGEGAVQRTVWPTVLGIVAIVFGALGVLGRGVSIVGSLVVAAVSRVEGEDAEMMMHVSDSVVLLNVVADGAGLLLAVVLLVGGIMLVQRKRAAVMTLVIWAWSRIALAFLDGYATASMQQEQFASMQAQGGAVPPGLDTAMFAMMAVFTIGLGIALPIVVLIVLSRPKAKAEVAQWQ